MIIRQLVLSKELYLAVFTLLLGGWCLDQTRGLDGDAWRFPFYLSALLTLLGVVLLVQCVLDKSERKVDKESLIAILRGAVPFAVVSGAWAWALNAGFGYLLPSVAAAYAMLWVLGFGTPLQTADPRHREHARHIHAVLYHI